MAAPRSKLADTWAKVAYYTSLGFVLPASVVGGVVLGWFLDEWLGTRPLLTVLLAALGAVAGFIELFRLLAREERREARRNDSNGSQSS